MGYTHYFKTKGDILSDKQVSDIKNLVSTAKKEFGVDLYNGWEPNGAGVYVGSGTPTINNEEIFFNHPAQESFYANFNEADGGMYFTKTMGSQPFAQEADMVTTSILLYLENQNLVSFSSDGIFFKRGKDKNTITVDKNVTNAYEFTEHVLGHILDDIGAIAQRALEEYMVDDKEYDLVVQKGDLDYSAATSAKAPGLSSHNTSANNKTDRGTCGFFMPRAKRACVLNVNHSGGHH